MVMLDVLTQKPPRQGRLLLTKSNMDKILEPAAETLAKSQIAVKPCTKCLEIKPIDAFSPLSHGVLGKQSWCKFCKRSYQKTDRAKAVRRIYRNSRLDKDRQREYMRNYYPRYISDPENKRKKRIYMRDYVRRPDVQLRMLEKRSDPDKAAKIREYWIAYRAKPENKARRSERDKTRRKTDLLFKIMRSLRSRVGRALKKGGKCCSTADLIGCDVGFLRRWIEVKWKPGMSWDNYGRKGWHIDHIMPCASFDLSDPRQQRICFRWTNLQPLWALDNIKKSDKIFETPAEPLA